MYRLRITLLDVEPSIWRTVLVPETLTLSKLHTVIQAAMDWTNSHLHEFVIAGRRYSDYLEPQWEPNEILNECGVVLEAALGPSARTFDYVYDFGDDWHHAIVLEERQPLVRGASSTVRCLAGERACPPQDVGGAHGYEEFLRALADPQQSRARGTASVMRRLVRFRAFRPQTAQCTAETDQSLTVKTALT